MTTSSGKTGRGVTIEISDGASPAAFTAIANVTSIQLSGRDAAEIDFTTLQSTGGFRELRQGFKDPGQLACEYHFDPTNATHTNLLGLFLSGDLFEFQINYSAAGWKRCRGRWWQCWTPATPAPRRAGRGPTGWCATWWRRNEGWR